MRNLKEFRVPGSPAEAVSMLRAGPGKGRFIAGGTDLNLARQGCDYLVDLKQAGINRINLSSGGNVEIGAVAPLQECFNSHILENFAGGVINRVAGQCGDRSHRTAATIGGNLCNALPSADMAPVLMALDAVCVIVDEDSRESLPLAEFFISPRRTVLGDRLLAGLVLPAETSSWRCQNYKLTRSADEIALVQVAVALELKDGLIIQARIALGAVAPIPLRSFAAEKILVGLKLSEITPDHVEHIAAVAAGQCDPIDDHRASAEYRTGMVRVWTRRLICRVLAEDGPEACGGGRGSGGDEGGAA